MNRKINLLIVDDNKELCSILNDFFLAKDDINIVGTAYDGIEALKLIKELTPDMVLLDMIMPELDGLGVLDRLNTISVDPVPKVIMLSTVGQDMLTQRALILGADYYIVKPFNFSVLLERIREILQSEYAVETVPNPVYQKEVTSMDSGLFNIEEHITTLIRTLGIPAHLSGYRYIRDAINICISQNGVMSITKDVYPQIAQKYNTIPSRVDRAIRNAIEVSYDRGNIDLLNSIVGYNIIGSKAKPTNVEFIAALADTIRLKSKKS